MQKRGTDKKTGAAARFRHDYEYRTVVSTLFSSAVTAAIGAYNSVLAAFAEGMGAVWFATLSGYYFFLAAARTAVLISHRIGLKRGENESLRERRNAKNYLACGGLLVPMTLAFAGVTILTVSRGFHQVYYGHLIFAAAFYAFYKIITAILNTVKAAKGESLTVQALRSICIADALVSVVSLQSAMLAAFPAGEGINVGIFNAATGGTACALILFLGAFMIIRGARRLKEPNLNK